MDMATWLQSSEYLFLYIHLFTFHSSLELTGQTVEIIQAAEGSFSLADTVLMFSFLFLVQVQS